MGKYLKFIIPLIVLALGITIFQNCGQKLQANGDPYENRIDINDPFIDSPAEGQSGAPNFVAETTCLPNTSGGALHVVSLGKENGVDSVYVQLNEGRFKVYKWPPGQSPLVLNDQLGKVKIQTVQFDSVNSLVRVQLTVTGQASSQEVLGCD